MRSAGACFCQISFSAFSFAIAPETESQTCRRRGAGVAQQRAGPAGAARGRASRWPWKTGRRGRGERRRLEQVGVAVAEGVDADAADPVEHAAAVGEAHAGARGRGPRGGCGQASGRPRWRAERAHARARRPRGQRRATLRERRRVHQRSRGFAGARAALRARRSRPSSHAPNAIDRPAKALGRAFVTVPPATVAIVLRSGARGSIPAGREPMTRKMTDEGAEPRRRTPGGGARGAPSRRLERREALSRGDPLPRAGEGAERAAPAQAHRRARSRSRPTTCTAGRA